MKKCCLKTGSDHFTMTFATAPCINQAIIRRKLIMKGPNRTILSI